MPWRTSGNGTAPVFEAGAVRVVLEMAGGIAAGETGVLPGRALPFYIVVRGTLFMVYHASVVHSGRPLSLAMVPRLRRM